MDWIKNQIKKIFSQINVPSSWGLPEVSSHVPMPSVKPPRIVKTSTYKSNKFIKKKLCDININNSRWNMIPVAMVKKVSFSI